MLKKTPLYAESWNVAFRKKSPNKELVDTLQAFTIIPNSFRYWAADPFVFEVDDCVYIFAELYDYILRRGVIGYCKIDDRKPTKWVPMIKEKHHLSYPCVFKVNDTIYIMPESGEGKELDIYEAIEFPKVWKKTVLRQNVNFADTTPLPTYEYRMALTHNVDNPEKPQLCLIDLENKSADKVIDALPFLSRPAGQVFVYNEKMIRPAQISENCGEGYGKGIVFYECNLNSDLEYKEMELQKIFPQHFKYNKKYFLDGMHTYNVSEHYEVVDIKTRRLNLLNLLMRIVGKFMHR